MTQSFDEEHSFLPPVFPRGGKFSAVLEEMLKKKMENGDVKVMMEPRKGDGSGHVLVEHVLVLRNAQTDDKITDEELLMQFNKFKLESWNDLFQNLVDLEKIAYKDYGHETKTRRACPYLPTSERILTYLNDKIHEIYPWVSLFVENMADDSGTISHTTKVLMLRNEENVQVTDVKVQLALNKTKLETFDEMFRAMLDLEKQRNALQGNFIGAGVVNTYRAAKGKVQEDTAKKL